MSKFSSTTEPVFANVPRSHRSSHARGWGLASLSATPVYQQVLTWLLFFPLLVMVGKGSLSFFSPPRTDFDYQNGYLANTAQGIRAPVVLNLLILAVFIAIGHHRVWRVLMNNRLILASMALGGISALWSGSPSLTLRMTAELVLSTCFTCYLSDRLSTERLMNLLMFIGLVAAALSTFLVIFFPAWGTFQGYAHGAWRGICTHKNLFGVSMAFLMTPAFFADKRRVSRLAYGSLMVLLVILSQSRGAWMATAGTLAFVCWLRVFRKLPSKEAWLMTIGTVFVATILVVIAIMYMEPFLRLLGKDPSMSGRTGIYEAVWHSILKRPLFGYGLGAFWLRTNPEFINIGLQLHWMSIGYAENGLLDLALQIGLVGVSLVVLMIGNAIRQAAILTRSPFYNRRVGWFITLLVLELFINIESGWLMAAHSLDWALTLIACIGLNNEMRQAAALRQQATMHSLQTTPDPKASNEFAVYSA